MNILIGILGPALIFFLVNYLLQSQNAEQQRKTRMWIGGSALVIGFFLCLAARYSLGVPLAAFGFFFLSRAIPNLTSGRPKLVYLRLLPDQPEGPYDDVEVIKGKFSGKLLSAMTLAEVGKLAGELAAFPHDRALLDAYLHSRQAGGAEHTKFDPAAGGGRAGSGVMTAKDAYQVLGLKPGASPSEIVEAHRRLIKTLHPDTGGSTYLAAQVNMAKDLLLN